MIVRNRLRQFLLRYQTRYQKNEIIVNNYWFLFIAQSDATGK